MLCETAGLPEATKYATLSHCWGTESFLCLTTSNYDDFLQHIPVEQLTKTMSDTTKAMQGSSDSDDGSSDGSDAVTDSYNQQMPGIMADAIMQSGGLGLARTIAQNLKGSQS